MNHFIPVHDFDSSACADDNKLKAHIDAFKQATGIERPDYIVRAPGRINLIGDHIDYHGFSVLPMAIENSVLIGISFVRPPSDAVAITENKTNGDIGHSDRGDSKRSKITILNSDPVKYPTFQGEHSFSYGSKLDLSHQWHHYILCGYHGVLARQLLALESSQIYEHSKSIVESNEYVNLDAKKLNQLSDFVLFVDSDLPPASGLSSSSALVCAAALATRLLLLKNEKEFPLENGESAIDTQSLAEDCAEFEHLVGTAGGGMDQAVILTAEEGYAKHIQFEPTFKCTNIRLPRDYVWLVSHCGHECAKAATLDFNSRVLETKIGAAILYTRLDNQRHGCVPIDSSITLGRVISKLRLPMFLGSPKLSDDLIEKMFEESFPRLNASMSLDEVCKILGMSRAELISKFGTSEEFLQRSQLDQVIKPNLRCQHVLNESNNVRNFIIECEASEGSQRLGKFINQSHDSLRDLFECSHPSLDRLVEISRDAGAEGARLTGAGWGGCVVTLVKESMTNVVEAKLREVSKFTFRTEPKAGASIIRVRGP